MYEQVYRKLFFSVLANLLSEVDGEYKNSNADSSDEESLAIATKRQHSTTKIAVSGSSKKVTANKEANKKKPAVKKARTPAPSKIDKGKRKVVSKNPNPKKKSTLSLLRPNPQLRSSWKSGRQCIPQRSDGDTQNTRLFPVRPGRAASTNEKDYPDVFIASHRLGAGYSVKDLVETTRNIGAVRQVVADHKIVTCAACAAGTHTRTCVPMGVGLPCVACRGSGIPCSLNSELNRLEVSSRTGYEVFAQCSPIIANQLRQINATTSNFVTASGLADAIKFNLGSEVAVLRNLLSNPARVFHQLKAANQDLKITTELVSEIGQLAGWTVSYSKTDIEDFLAQPAPADDAAFHPISAAASEITTIPPLNTSNFFLPVGNKPTPIDIKSNEASSLLCFESQGAISHDRSSCRGG
ncbi:hypothetical protein K435DRAFT_794703 [Dendrothele bispora CBS 962.96]|uniref:Zn(2)-C6 fungal-type domain-containing protein n=1 Tax=Dendrothele bispora (strain CBS 962.96) TaxID=1314807 RepID=A0A4S8MBB0_DENBC|nr:hypothetical protein K435DRAFT_794703 [Dendrothele bispora CBS 962.96]